MRKRWPAMALVAAVLALMAAGTGIYVGDYYHADERAEEALASDESVEVSETDYGWFFDGPSEENVLIFYPGGKVEETAYAPLLHALAAEDLDVCLVKMPGRLAILGMDRADRVLEEYDYGHVYIGGHSLGGACASGYAAGREEVLDGLILLAAYPMKELAEGLEVTFIYGSEDGVLNMEKYAENRKYAPDDAAEYVIPGGNHAGFGAYGAQEGDGEARITPEDQVRETVRIIREAVGERQSEQ